MNQHPCCATDPKTKEELRLELLKELEDIPPEEVLDELGSAFHALSHPIRLKIAFLLLLRDHCVCELIEQLNKKPNLISHHLSVMKGSGLVSTYLQSKWKFYKLNDSTKHILNSLKEV